MWSAFRIVDSVDGHIIEELMEFETLEDPSVTEMKADDEVVIIWSGDIPSDGQAAGQLLERVRALNNGRVSHLVLGEVQHKNADPTAACSGSCFCVVAHGTRECQVQVCKGNACWWVSCGSAC